MDGNLTAPSLGWRAPPVKNDALRPKGNAMETVAVGAVDSLPPLVRLTDAAELLSVSPRHLLRLVQRGEIRGYRLGGHCWRLDVGSVHAFLDRVEARRR
jgi:excisionase family DNA binding protein